MGASRPIEHGELVVIDEPEQTHGAGHTGLAGQLLHVSTSFGREMSCPGKLDVDVALSRIGEIDVSARARIAERSYRIEPTAV